MSLSWPTLQNDLFEFHSSLLDSSAYKQISLRSFALFFSSFYLFLNIHIRFDNKLFDFSFLTKSCLISQVARHSSMDVIFGYFGKMKRLREKEGKNVAVFVVRNQTKAFLF